MKVICPNCGKVINTISNKDKVFCNKCGMTFFTNQGKELFDKRYKAVQKNAYNKVYINGEYEEGYKAYEACLELQENDLTSITGMCFARIYGQTFDKLMFTEVKNIINKYDIVLNTENTFVYLSFVNDMFRQINYFYSQVDERLKENDIFLSLVFFNYFKEGVNQIEELVTFFKESLEIVEESEFKEFTQENTIFLGKFDDNLEKIKKFKEKNYSVNKVGIVNFNGDVIEEKNFDEEVTKDITDMSLEVILVDEKAKRNTYIVGGIVFLLIIVAIIMVVVGYVTQNYALLYGFLIPLAIGGLIAFGYHKFIR